MKKSFLTLLFVFLLSCIPFSVYAAESNLPYGVYKADDPRIVDFFKINYTRLPDDSYIVLTSKTSDNRYYYYLFTKINYPTGTYYDHYYKEEREFKNNISRTITVAGQEFKLYQNALYAPANSSNCDPIFGLPYDSLLCVTTSPAFTSLQSIFNVIYDPDFVYEEQSSFVFDSSIPAPENLTFSSSRNGGFFGIGEKVNHKLSWTNTLVDDYSVRISARIHVTDGNGYHYYDDVLVASDGSDGSDLAYLASSGSFEYDYGTMITDWAVANSIDMKSYPYVSVDRYRVQFYKITDGQMSVGPVGVISVTRDSNQVWKGTSVTTERPLDPDNIGSSGGLYSGSSDGWSSKGNGYIDYDTQGNVSGSGTVGDPDSYVPTGNATQSWQEMISNMLNSFLNIPTILSQFFNSLTGLMSDIGQFPQYMAQVVTWLPASMLSLITLGLIVVVALRIFGR